MNTNEIYNKSNSDRQDAFERQRLEYEGLPEPVRVRPLRTSRYRVKGGLPIDELERISAMRLWAPLAGIPVEKGTGDDFEPPMPDMHRLGCSGE